ncbi:uncharacterized protein [Trachinotus anak]|uniref:uncharacterized protein n=1 Tax=Trachinotus anak TaxID=443729 RepID=UPI0039F260C1
MRLIDMKPEPVQDLSLQDSDAHECDSDKNDNAENDAGEEECKTPREMKPGPKVSITHRTEQTPVGTQREMDPRQSHVISVTTDGAGCSKDSEKEQMYKLHSGFAHTCVYPPELNTHLWDRSIPNSLFHSAQVNSWATMDRAVASGLSLAAPVRTPGTAGFPTSLQQQALVQDLMSFSHFGGFLFYPYASLSVRSKVDFRTYPSVHRRDYFTSPIISSSVAPVGGGPLKYHVPDLLMVPKTEQMNSLDEAEIDCSQDKTQTARTL